MTRRRTAIVVLTIAVVAAGGSLGALALSGSGDGSGGGGAGGSSGTGHGAGSATTTSFSLPSPPTTVKREADVYVVSGSGTMHMVETASGSCTGTIVADLTFSISGSDAAPGTGAPGGAVTAPVDAQNTWGTPTGITCTVAGRTIEPIPAMSPQSHVLAASIDVTIGAPTEADLKVPSAQAAAGYARVGCSRVISGSNGHVQVCNASLDVAYSLPEGLTSGTGKLKCTPSSAGPTAVALSGTAPSTTKPPSCKMSPSTTYTGTLDLDSQPCFDFVATLPGEEEACTDSGSLSIKVKTEKRKYRSDPVLAPGRVTFPGQHDGTTGPPEVMTLTNEAAATASLTVAGLGITGSAHAKFPVSDDHCTGAVLQPGQSCMFSVAFAPGPSDHGIEDATLKVITDAKVGTLTAALYARSMAWPSRGARLGRARRAPAEAH